MTSRVLWRQRDKERTNVPQLISNSGTAVIAALPRNPSSCRPTRRRYVVSSDTTGPKPKTVITIQSYHASDPRKSAQAKDGKRRSDINTEGRAYLCPTLVTATSITKSHNILPHFSDNPTNRKLSNSSTPQALSSRTNGDRAHCEGFSTTADSDESSVYEDAMESFGVETPGSPSSTLFDHSSSNVPSLGLPWSPLVDTISIHSTETLVDDGLSPWGLPKAMSTFSDDEYESDEEADLNPSEFHTPVGVTSPQTQDYTALVQKIQQIRYTAMLIDASRKLQRLKQEELRFAAINKHLTAKSTSASFFSQFASWI